MSVSKYVDKIWQNMARKQLENELNFLTTDDNERIKLPIDDSIDYLKIYGDTHKTPEEELQERIDKALDYIENFIEYDEETDTVSTPYTFDGYNLGKLWKILKGEDNE